MRIYRTQNGWELEANHGGRIPVPPQANGRLTTREDLYEYLADIEGEAAAAPGRPRAAACHGRRRLASRTAPWPAVPCRCATMKELCCGCAAWRPRRRGGYAYLGQHRLPGLRRADGCRAHCQLVRLAQIR